MVCYVLSLSVPLRGLLCASVECLEIIRDCAPDYLIPTWRKTGATAHASRLDDGGDYAFCPGAFSYAIERARVLNAVRRLLLRLL